jgi:hypothetical protein
LAATIGVAATMGASLYGCTVESTSAANDGGANEDGPDPGTPQTMDASMPRPDATSDTGGANADADAGDADADANAADADAADAHASDAMADVSIDASADAVDDQSSNIRDGGPPDVVVPTCTSLQRTQKLALADARPTTPLVGTAGLSFVGANMHRLDLVDAENALCAGDWSGDVFGDGTQVMTFGTAAEIWFNYDPQTLRANVLMLYPGYTGTVDFKSANQMHTYSIGLETPIKKDAQTFALDWNDAVHFDQEVNELYAAMVATFAPQLPLPSGSCLTSMDCTRHDVASGGAYLYFSKLGFAFWVQSTSFAQPTPSMANRFDLYPPP